MNRNFKPLLRIINVCGDASAGSRPVVSNLL